jgi:hypothetical protein
MSIHEDAPIDEYDPEFDAFCDRTGCNSYKEFYEQLAEEERIIDLERESISVNPWEMQAIAYGLKYIAKTWFHTLRYTTRHNGDSTPNLFKGAESLAKKIGLHLFNPYNFENYKEFLKYKGYEPDEDGLIWYKDGERELMEQREKEYELIRQKHEKAEPDMAKLNKIINDSTQILGEKK